MAKKAGDDKHRKRKKARHGSNPTNAHAAATDASCKPAAVERWLDDAGVEWRECCRLGEAASGGQGVFAVRDIAAGEVVLAVPDDAVLMPDDCCIAKELQEADLGHEGRGGERGEGIALALALMAEAHAGEHSSHAAYIASLPRAMPGVPVCWAAEERAFLAGTAAADKLDGVGVAPGALSDWGPSIELPSQIDSAWEEVAQPFVSQHSQHFGTAEADWRSRFEWATAVVAAYSFELGDDKYQAMVPLWDALNHITGRCNVRLHHHEQDERLQMIATEPIRAGSELINNYGELGNAELLRRFGFVEPCNPHDCAQVPWTAVYDAAVSIAFGSNEAEALQHAVLPSEKELKRRWRRLRYQRAVPESGYFSIVRDGKPEALLALAARAALADLRSRSAAQQKPAPDAAEQPHAAAGPSTGAVSAAQQAAGDARLDGPKAKRRRKAGQDDVKSSPVAPVSAADVLEVLNGLIARTSRYLPECSSGVAADAVNTSAADQAQDPASQSWRKAAALLVRQGELDCWKACAGQWLASPDVEQQVADMLSSRQ